MQCVYRNHVIRLEPTPKDHPLDGLQPMAIPWILAIYRNEIRVDWVYMSAGVFVSLIEAMRLIREEHQDADKWEVLHTDRQWDRRVEKDERRARGEIYMTCPRCSRGIVMRQSPCEICGFYDVTQWPNRAV